MIDAIIGTTTNNKTDSKSVSYGTTILLNPSNKATIGVKANNSITSLNATCSTV